MECCSLLEVDYRECFVEQEGLGSVENIKRRLKEEGEAEDRQNLRLESRYAQMKVPLTEGRCVGWKGRSEA